MRAFKSSVLILLLISVVAAHAEEPLPVEAFASLPVVSNVRLSPDGEHVVFLVKVDAGDLQGAAVRFMNLDTNELDLLTYADSKDFVINWIRWANNRQVLISARFPAKRWGTPTTETRLLVANIDDGELRSALPASFLRRLDWVPQIQDEIVDILPSDPDHILLEGRFDSQYHSGIVKTSLVDNRVSKVERGRDNVIDWVTDRQNRPRIAVLRDDATYFIRHQAVDSKKGEILWEFEAFAEDQVWPMGFALDADVLYVRAYHEGLLAVFKVRLSDPNLERELVFSDPFYDVDGSLIYSAKTGDVIGIRHSTGGGYTFWDPEAQKLQEAINTALPDTYNRLYSLSDNERRYIVLATSDTDAGTYYVGDRDEKRLLQLSPRYPDLPNELMAEKRPISYEARDGLMIEGYLTLPRGDVNGPVPAIVFPHGGPIVYEGSGFDYWTQYFASRGYAVLQMNFRGSAGYGYDFMASGLKGWGLEMQNDVEDGTRWLIEEGIADPDRICAVGASYGGYAALMEAARNPDLYRCAVSFAGVTDVAYLVKSHRRYSNYEVVREQIGTDFSELRDRSPLHNAESIDIPVLLAHGTEDRSVRLRHSEKMAKELEKEGKDVTYLEFEDGDHYLSSQEHRIAFFKAMDAFLQEHL
ncbi:MAG: S9 family peptidase [Woeseiaceae bacterium]|nr:S9 family peptidase [Woeseiaceae bacterium]